MSFPNTPKMMSRKSILCPAVEDLQNESPSASSPLRRRSVVAQKVVTLSFEENDDEAERMVRRLQQNNQPAARIDKRKSLGLGLVAQVPQPQIAEKISQCIKLGAENKINTKNAFSLEMIDFMAYLIRKQDGNMSNLQVASTSLDVSTKIYGFRVDGVHSEILKMIDGMGKQEKGEGRSDGREENMEASGVAGDGTDAQGATKKKRKSKMKILATAETLKGHVETTNPTSFMFGEGDSQTTDLLYQAILPHHTTSGIYLNPYNDILLDTVDPSIELTVDSTRIPCRKIENFANADMCQSFANFEFLGWSADEEIDLTPEKSQSISEAFQFDLDASLPADEEPTNCGLNYFDMENDGDNENVERCRGTIDRAGPANIVDLRAVVQASKHLKNSEYSYFQDGIDIQWVGPSHWKIRHVPKNLGGSRVVEGCGQEAVRRKKELLLVYDDEVINATNVKFDVARSNTIKLQSKTAKNHWSEEKLTLPQNVHFENSECCKIYLRPAVLMKLSTRNQLNATNVSDEVANYDYNNEHDTGDYCPNIQSEEAEINDSCNNNDGDFDEAISTQGPGQSFTGDNLVEAPKINSKIFLPYSQRAKKIDMKQLKKCIWKNLTSTSNLDKENVGDSNEKENVEKVIEIKNFSTIYKELPMILSKANVEALSCPIAFISLLHIANEKCLQIKSNADYSDLIVQQG